MGKRYDQETLDKILNVLNTEEEKTLIKEADDPVIWAEKHLWHPDDGDTQFETKKMFCNLLRDPKKNRAGRVGRQCLIQGTVIHTRNGKLVPIEDHPDSWLTSKDREVFKLKVWGGYSVTATDNHPFMTNNGWKQLSEIKVGDKVKVLTRWNKWGNDKVNYSYNIGRGKYRKDKIEGTYNINEEIAELLGWLTADGTGFRKEIEKCSKQSIKFTNINDIYLDRVEYLVNNLFPDIKCTKYKKGKGYDMLFTTSSKATGSNPLKHFFRCMDFSNGFPTAATRNFSKKSVEAFFRGMYPADGYVNLKPVQKYECGLSCGNDWIYAQYCRELLNKLGIRSQIKQEKMAKASPGAIFNRVVFSGTDNAIAFKNTIKCILDKKSPVINDKRKPSTISKTFEEVDGEETHYAKVTSIKPDGRSPVWDVEYPGKGWFVAGGILTHNSGKTIHMVVDIMHTAAHETRGILMVFIPEKKQMNRMLEIMRNLLRKSDVKSSYRMGKKKASKDGVEPMYDYEINVSSGSVIRFFFMSHNPDKARGQRGTHIYMDEVEYLPDKAFPVILGVLKSNPQMPIWATSTPTGLEGTWFRNFCESCADPNNTEGAEYHISTIMEANWPEIEKRLREVIYDEVTWKLEVLAEWAEAKGAIYKKEVIDTAVSRSIINGFHLKSEEIYETLEYRSALKFLGVDWNNPQNGVRIVEIAHMFDAPWVVRNEKIAYEKYTQLSAVARIMELYNQHLYCIMAVDAGYGSAQIELIHEKLVSTGKDPSKILHIVDAGKKEDRIIEYKSPVTGGRKKDKISVRVKNILVGGLTRILEENLTLLKEEDEDKDGIVFEVRNFRRKSANTSSTGFQYSENTHSLSALQMGVHGYNKYMSTANRSMSDAVQNMRSGYIENLIANRRAADDKRAQVLFSSAGSRTTKSRTSGLGYGRSGRHII